MVFHDISGPNAPVGRDLTRRQRRGVRGGAVLLGLGLLSVTGASPVGAQSNGSGLTYTGRAAALYSPTGVTVLGSQVIAPETALCQAGPLPPAGGSFTACNGNLTLPGGLGTINVLNQSVNGAGGTSTANSEVASADLLPNPIGGILGIAPLLANIDATVLAANTSVTCTSHSESSSLATLTLNNNNILPASTSPNQTVNVLNNGAIITVNYQQYDAATNTATASPLRIEFPANGPLSGVITGTIFVSYAQSDLHGCPPPVISEVSTAVVLPLAAIGLFGGAFLVLRRRGRIATVQG